MKRKIILIFSIVLLVFSLSFLVGQKVVSSRLNDNSVNNTAKKEEKITNKEETNNKDEINNEETEENIKEEQEIENSQEKEVEKKTDTKTNTKTDTKTNTDTKKTTNVKDNSNTTITSSNNETNKPKTETIEEKEVSSTKYGVKFLNVKKFQVTTYSDGTVDKKLVSTYKSMDTSGYNGTAETLKDEATALVNSNWSKYNEVLGYVNTYRSEKGVSALTLDRELSIAATIRALEMAYTDNMSHTRPNMSGANSCFTVLDELGISRGYATGENVAVGYSSPKAVAEGWKNSPDHYANMIDTRFSKIGIGMAQLSGTTYGTFWAQLFVG